MPRLPNYKTGSVKPPEPVVPVYQSDPEDHVGVRIMDEETARAARSLAVNRRRSKTGIGTLGLGLLIFGATKMAGFLFRNPVRSR